MVLIVHSGPNGLQSSLQVVAVWWSDGGCRLTCRCCSTGMLAVSQSSSKILVLVRVDLTCLLSLEVLLVMAGRLVALELFLLRLRPNLSLLHQLVVSVVAFVDLGSHDIQQLQLPLYGIVRFFPCCSEAFIAGAWMRGKVRKDQVGMSEEEKVGSLVVAFALVDLSLRC